MPVGQVSAEDRGQSRAQDLPLCPQDLAVGQALLDAILSKRPGDDFKVRFE